MKIRFNMQKSNFKPFKTSSRKLIILLLAAVFFQACSTAKWIAPPYTNVSKITNIKAGMGLGEINNVLGIEPYDVYHIQEDGSTVLVYNYRLKERRMEVPADPINREKKIRNSESSQTEGEVWYGEPSQLFVLMKDNKMKSMITDNGSANSAFLLLQNNNIQLISKSEAVNMGEGGGSGGNRQSSVMVPLNKTTKKPMQQQQIEEKKGNKALGAVLGVIAATSLIILLLVVASE